MGSLNLDPEDKEEKILLEKNTTPVQNQYTEKFSVIFFSFQGTNCVGFLSNYLSP
jgi:hypothetical protein